METECGHESVDIKLKLGNTPQDYLISVEELP